jgi:cellulose synthase/poly-beta-1,6-N-acetylglucosamine synthase-like glycosyltransferase
VSDRAPGEAQPPVPVSTYVSTERGEGAQVAVISDLVSASLHDPVVALAVAASIHTGDIHCALRSALINKTDFVDELLILNRNHEQRIYAAFAAKNSLGFLAEIDPLNLIMNIGDQDRLNRRLPFVNYSTNLSETQLLAAPPPSQLRHLLTQNFDTNRLPRLRIVTPSELNRAVEVYFSHHRAYSAVHNYATLHPEHSSRVTLHGWQGWFFGFIIGASPALFIFFPDGSLIVVHLVTWLFFFGCVALRLMAAFTSKDSTPEPVLPFERSTLPEYAVLVALYKEASVASQLIACMRNLNWPSTKLKIFLICEEDDAETLAALEMNDLPPNFRIISVPIYGPRTKPKALMYALPLVEAEYLVLYDAEDRPHPDQLLEAYQKFESGGLRTGCVQAPLEITNRKHSILTGLFAFEYGALFRGLLPFLSRFNLFIPLGGTSNHFRVNILRQVGGWDPFNVTEDADLGLRLHRYGYQTKTITRPTLEDAPEELVDWIKQRTRWFKGHMQTWMISLRNPSLLIDEIGWMSFLVSQIMLGGIVVSALAHPVMVLSVVVMGSLYIVGEPLFDLASPLAMLDLFNLTLGYLAFMLLGYFSARGDEKAGIWQPIIAIPPYWLLLSFAAWRALFQIIKSPHKWEKTPHKPTLGAV